jgi:ribosomal protein S18 acetylase RimI-like enzyme
VRRAAAEDAARIARVRGQTWRAAYSHIFTREQLDTISEQEDTERWSGHLRNLPPRAATFVAARAGEIVGFASVGPTRAGDDPSQGELYAIYVLPETWGSGIGRALMAEALDGLRAEGFAGAVLWVLEDNPRTRRFYELAGWTADGEVMDGEWLGSRVREVRYRISL